MRVLVHASPTTLEPFRSPNLGVLCSPRRVYADELAGWTYAADNDAFSSWDAGRFEEMLAVLKRKPELPLFVTAPDVVGDAHATALRFSEWADHMLPLPIAYVLQDGVLEQEIPWPYIAAVFVGGSTEFKLSPRAALFVRRAKALGLWAHMGRVNSHRRLMYAKAIGCDSVDGTSLSWFRGDGAPKRARDRDRLRRFIAHAAQPAQGILEGS